MKYHVNFFKVHLESKKKEKKNRQGQTYAPSLVERRLSQSACLFFLRVGQYVIQPPFKKKNI
jgi:hypothetical protein